MTERRRGCGYRKVGGIYLVSEGTGDPCCKLPILLHVCPTCNQGVKQTRGWSWIDPRPWLTGDCKTSLSWLQEKQSCPAADPSRLGEKVGLLWIGEQFYPTPYDFVKEGHEMGWSRRIKVIPRGFKVGEHYIFLAHPKVKKLITVDGKEEWQAGVFYIWRPTRIEKLITDLDAANPEILADLEERGIEPVIVPHDDKRFQGSVFDKEQMEMEGV